MKNFPRLQTKRLNLRAFTLDDVPAVTRYCSAWEIAATTANIPHPYDESMAESWILSHRQAYEKGEAIPFAITLIEDRELVGAIGIHINEANNFAEIGYWIGMPFWNRGVATEATQAVISYGFSDLKLNRIFARHMTKNPASGRVMQKAGMVLEGILRQSIYRWGTYEDAAVYSILLDEYAARRLGGDRPALS